MANLQKYTMGAAGHMFAHYGRQQGEAVERSNKSIDDSRTHLNYDLSGHSGPQMERLKKRLSEVKHLDLTKRKDINVMCTWVITLPENVPPERAEEFFKAAYDFCQGRYGQENVISSWVHMDETTPHMHFCFVPVKRDANGSERLCAKEVIDRIELKKFHPALQKHCEDVMGQPVAVLNGATAGGNLTILELKQKEVLKELTKAKAESIALETLTPTVEKVKEYLESVGKFFQELDTKLKGKKFLFDGDRKKLDTAAKDLAEIRECFKQAVQDINLTQKVISQLSPKLETEVDGVLAALRQRERQAERRIKRVENTLNRRERELNEREQQINLEISKGVSRELQRRQDQINSLEYEKAMLQDQLAALRTDFWSADFLKEGLRRQEEFTSQIERWRNQYESEITKPTIPERQREL